MQDFALPLIVLVLISPLLIMTFLMRQRFTFLRTELKAHVTPTTLWFYHKGIPVILVSVAAVSDSYGKHGKYMKGFPGALSRGDRPTKGYSPLLTLVIPLEGALRERQWFIVKKGDSPIAQKLISFLSGPTSHEMTINGSKYQIWARQDVVQQDIVAQMNAIAPKLDALFSKNITWAILHIDIGPLFYGWSLHLTRFVVLAGLPEDLYLHPEKVRSTVDGFVEILQLMGEKMRT